MRNPSGRVPDAAQRERIHERLPHLRAQKREAVCRWSGTAPSSEGEAPQLCKVPGLQCSMSSAGAVCALGRDRRCAAHAALRPGHGAV